MEIIQIEAYSLQELKEKFPESYQKVLEKWQKFCDEDSYLPWQDETIDSLKATIKAFSAKLKDWSIGPYNRSYCKVEVYENEDANDNIEFIENILTGLGYEKDVKNPENFTFPGLCPFTGYFADDDFIESVYKDVKGGDSLKQALENLAMVASKIMEDDFKQWRGEETMMANWDENKYNKDGIEIIY